MNREQKSQGADTNQLEICYKDTVIKTAYIVLE
jgi:hypothetical protein